MNITKQIRAFSASVLILCLAAGPNAIAQKSFEVKLEKIGEYRTGIFDDAGAEIVAYDQKSKRAFVTNVHSAAIDVLDLSNPNIPNKIFSISVAPYGKNANSVVVEDGIVAAAVENVVKTDVGFVVFFDVDGNYINKLTVGALPDSLTVSPDKKMILVANEGEPNDAYTVDPEGSISIIPVQFKKSKIQSLTDSNVLNLDFQAFNSAVLDPRIRIYGPGATAAKDLEPEYIAVTEDSKTAWVTLQENNAFAKIDLVSKQILGLYALGTQNHLDVKFDASDRDTAINIANWPVKGIYQPDTIKAYKSKGKTYLVTANEGDTRAYTGYNEEARVSTLTLDPTIFPNAAALKNNAALGRLTVTKANGDIDNDGDYDELYVPGGRSFSIWDQNGNQVYNSRDQFEQIIKQKFPANFNANNTENTFDNRSDNKGPEPEGLEIGEMFGRVFAFVTLERMGGIMIFDITDPSNVTFSDYFNDRNFGGNPATDTAGDLAPEGLVFIPSSQGPTKDNLLVAANEVSGSTSVYKIVKK